MADEIKTGCYICKGCGIEDRLDISALETIATREGKMGFVKVMDQCCDKESADAIKADIDNGEVTNVVIAACSRRAKTELFNFDDAVVVRTNLREGVIWVRPDTDENKETTQEMGEDYVRMGCAEARFSHAPKPSGEQSFNRHVLVVGGGLTGMTAAVEAARAGYAVTLVEKSGELGGWTREFRKRIPTRSPYAEPEDTPIEALAAEIEASSLIEVRMNSTIAKTEGAPGRFSVDIATESGDTKTETFGSIIQATGYKVYDPSDLKEFAYTDSPDVITNMEMEKLAKEANGGPIKRPSDGKEVQSVVFVQNVGQNSDEEGHLPYHSGIGDLVSIKQAMYCKEGNDDCETTILFDNLRTPGAGGEDFYRAGQDLDITFFKGSVNQVSPGDQIKVNYKDKILDDDLNIDCDLVVLDVGMVPNTGPNPYAAEIQAEEDAEEAAAAKKAGEEAPDHSDREVVIPVESILNLDYRQGTDLPHLKHGFVDSHFICFPYETRRTGIYAAGPVRRPMDTLQASLDATGAAMKAIQEIENAGLGRAAHPRSGDLSFPTFRMEGCTQCKRCTVECPFGAINEDEKGYPQYNESRCRRCGTCMGACPVRVISFENYSVDTVGQQIKAVDIPDEFDEKPRILVLACENDAYPALDMAGQQGIEYSAFVRVIPIRCLGSVNTIWISDAMNGGYDGIALMGCKKGEDYQCHFVKGSELAHYRVGKIAETLEGLGLEKERVEAHEVAITDIHKAPKIINDLADLVEKIGMSPFKF